MSIELGEKDISIVFNDDGEGEITILNGDDSGITFKYGKVTLDQDESGEPCMSFGYEILKGTPTNKDTFVDSIAHLLQKMILQQLERGEVTYLGGDPSGTVMVDKDYH